MLSRTLLIVLICSSCQVNQFSKKQLVYDLLFEKVQVSENVEIMVNVTFKLLKNVFPNLTDKQLNEFKRTVDYSALEDEFQSSFRNHYSLKEAKKAILEIEKNGLKGFKYKSEVNKDIHEIGKKFSGDMYDIVKEKTEKAED